MAAAKVVVVALERNDRDFEQHIYASSIPRVRLPKAHRPLFRPHSAWIYVQHVPSCYPVGLAASLSVRRVGIWGCPDHGVPVPFGVVHQG